jgi:hypothetical protein
MGAVAVEDGLGVGHRASGSKGLKGRQLSLGGGSVTGLFCFLYDLSPCHHNPAWQAFYLHLPDKKTEVQKYLELLIRKGQKQDSNPDKSDSDAVFYRIVCENECVLC